MRAAIERVLGRVEERIRELGAGFPEPDDERRPGSAAELRAQLARIAASMGWEDVGAAATEALGDLLAEHEGASDEAYAAMAEVVGAAFDDLAQAPGDLPRRLTAALDEALARGAAAADLVEQLVDEAAAHLVAVGTDFATSLMGLHREGTLREMEDGGLDLLVYDGPDDEVIRPFCADLVGRVTTEQDLDGMDNGQGLAPTSRYMGGYNCRHVPAPITVEEARGLPRGSVVGFLARRIVAGALGPNEARFQLEHLGELTAEGVVRRHK